MVALVFVYLLSLHSSWLTILKQIGATHCKLSVELMGVCSIHHFHFAPAQHLACMFLRVRFQFMVAHVFSAFPSSKCTHLYFPYTFTPTAPEKLCIMRSSRLLFEHTSLAVGYGALCETCILGQRLSSPVISALSQT